jgi:hypothetical protein
MADTAEHAPNTPFFAWPILVTAKLFAAHSTMNDLSFSKDMQVKLIDISAHTKMYFLVLLQGGIHSLVLLYVIRIHKKYMLFCYYPKPY